MENSTEIFAIALGISRPWFIEKIAFEIVKNKKELHIYLNFEKGFKFKDDNGVDLITHDTHQRTWQHMNFFEHKCFLHCRVPRVKNWENKVSSVAVPWARKGSGFTLLFEAFSMLLIESEMPISKVGKVMSVFPQRIWNVFHYWISIAHQKDQIGKLEKLGFDETSSKKGHKYVTTLVDLDARRVLFASEGKGSENIKVSIDYLKSKDVELEGIKSVCIDMSPAFISGCEQHLPNAEITFDKFHVIKEVNKAMDEVRKAEGRLYEDLKGHKYTFLKNKLSAQKKAEQSNLVEKYENLGNAHTLVQMFKDFWLIKDITEAETYLAFWCDIAEDSNLIPFINAVKTIKNHWTGIVNYIKSKISNGILEGINSKIQLAKKRARGYRNIPNFISMIYFISGKLKFDYPQYST